MLQKIEHDSQVGCTGLNIGIRVVLYLMILALGHLAGAADGKGAQALLQNGNRLSLTSEQRAKITAIVRKTVVEYNRVRRAESGQPGLEAKLGTMRQASQTEAVKLLNEGQLKIWKQLAGGVDRSTSSNDRVAARSLIIPTIAEMRNPPSPNAFGPTAGITETKPHPTLGKAYVVLTDHTNMKALTSLQKLAAHRGGQVIKTGSLGDLFKADDELERLRAELKSIGPRYVAIAPRLESYRENMHLCVLELLAGLDDDPQLDVFLGYLMASGPDELAALVGRTIAFKPIASEEIAPVSIGTIEDNDTRRYRSYQKAKVMQRVFADQGKESPAIIITTRKSHTERDDFPKLSSTGNNIAMLPPSERHTFASLSDAATAALSKNNVLFMFGHGTPERIVGTRADAFGEIEFADELVFCGSCMSASPYRADRLNLEAKKDHKRFAFHAVDNGAVMMLGHMGLCGGFPKVYPMAEHVLNGMSTGEAYQRLMNSLIGNRKIPAYYPEPAPEKAERRDPANGLLYILWGDPALVPIQR